MSPIIRPLAAAALLAVVATPAQATTYVWYMTCTEDQVSNSGVGDGSTDSTAVGDAYLRHDTLTGRFSYEIEWDGLEGLLSAIHVHGPAAPLANNMQHIFNIYTDASDVIAAGVDRTTDRIYGFDELAQLILDSSGPHNEVNALSYMVDELAYVNIHSELWPMGEIRCHFALSSTLVDTEQTKGQQKCTTGMHKAGLKVAKAQSKQIASCIKTAGTDGPTGSEACILADPKNKIAGARTKTSEFFGASCSGGNLPAYGVSDANTVSSFSALSERSVAHDLFSLDLDTGLAGPGETAACQAAAYKAAAKCSDAWRKDFVSCAKSDLSGKVGLTVVDGYGLAKCIGSDRKGKASKACDPVAGKVRAAIDKGCVDAGVDLAVAFPGCGEAAAADVAACVDRAALCRVCEAISIGGTLNVSCDQVDDGIENGSCSGV